MAETEGKLLDLIEYWVEHNREHEQEFRDWAEKVASLSGEVAKQLLEAASRMDDASACLEKARDTLKQGSS